MSTANIRKAAELLDQKGPAKWWRKINTDNLDMMSGHDCILGQIYGDYYKGKRSLGYESFIDEVNYIEAFCNEHNKDLWITEIQNRLDRDKKSGPTESVDEKCYGFSSTYETVKITSIKEVYGTDKPIIPKGYKAIAFRPAKRSEHYLLAHTFGVHRAASDFTYEQPRIIVVEYKPKTLTFTETEDSPRRVKNEEYYLGINDKIYQWVGQESIDKYTVFKQEIK